ncbi:transporter substrate-binding domain-containing protein [Pseudoduganella sp. FT25W]|uniref:Transporter substrate-binding domain-containing protein n=2 Tax=Duganella alba TaxID=2666081 RepID=A0A6L5QFB4_9BURK|nr:transporter substrate-binding domain-containing protein [Duganella alba]MRX17079.1 transporter substrate-binding domain-containing protein [Duganella alba]
MKSMPMMLVMLLAAAPTHAAEKPPLRYVEKIDAMLGPDQQKPSPFQQKMGAALARQLGRQVQFVSLPRTRIMAALESGDGDVLCSYLPEWTPGDVDWTRAFIPVVEVLLTLPHVKAPESMEELRGKRIGTVLGFRYPTMEKALGKDFIRDDAPTSTLSLKKWTAGRFDYLLTPRNVITQHLNDGMLPPGYHSLTISEVKTKCAVSRKSKITVEEVDAAINALEKNGELPGILKLR